MEEHFQALTEWFSLYGYPVLFTLVLAESAGLPVPGETAVLAASVLASRPDSPLSIVWVIPIVIAAAIIGDNFGFWAGHRWARPRLRAGQRFLFLTPQALQMVEGYFEHYGMLTVIAARFMAGLRVIAALAAGTSGMPWPRFLLANAVGAVAWGTTMSLLGYFFGQSWQSLHKWLGRGAVLLLACGVLLVGLPYLLRHLRRLPSVSWDRLLRARVWEGLVAAVLVAICVALLVALAEHHARPIREDEQVRQWIESLRTPFFDTVAAVGSYVSSLPVIAAVTAILLAWSWHAGRPKREQVAILWTLIGSEGVGLALLALIRRQGIEPARALAWPFGFAGLAPLRAMAVYGMANNIIHLLAPSWRRTAAVVIACIVLIAGFSTVWLQEQSLTEVLVEYVAGGLVLFLGLWWLEKYGLNLPPHSHPASGTVNTERLGNES